jgi:hypothetical protein
VGERARYAGGRARQAVVAAAGRLARDRKGKRTWTLLGAIAAATKAYEGVKLLRDLEKNFDEASFKLRIAEITSNLADLKMALSEANPKPPKKMRKYCASKKSSLSELKIQLSCMDLDTKSRAPGRLKVCRFVLDVKKSMAA